MAWTPRPRSGTLLPMLTKKTKQAGKKIAVNVQFDRPDYAKVAKAAARNRGSVAGFVRAAAVKATAKQ